MKEPTAIKYPTTGWRKSLEKLPLFTKGEMKKHIGHSAPTSLKHAKTFLHNDYLKETQANDDENHFYFKCKCNHSYNEKHKAPHTMTLAFCIISASNAGKVGHASSHVKNL